MNRYNRIDKREPKFFDTLEEAGHFAIVLQQIDNSADLSQDLIWTYKAEQHSSGKFIINIYEQDGYHVGVWYDYKPKGQ